MLKWLCRIGWHQRREIRTLHCHAVICARCGRQFRIEWRFPEGWL